MVCRHCKKQFYSDQVIRDYKNTINGRTYIYYSCRPCNTARVKKYRDTESGKRSILKSIKKYTENNPKRVKAWQKAQAIPSQPCVACGAKKTHRHHPDISDPMRVVFLCPLHHKQVHMSMVE